MTSQTSGYGGSLGVTPWSRAKFCRQEASPGLGTEMNGSGALDLQGRDREWVIPGSVVGAACVCM